MGIGRAVGAVHSVKIGTGYPSTDDEMMITPRVIASNNTCACSSRIERPAKIGHCELRNFVRNSLCDHLVIKGSHGLAELDQQIILLSDLAIMRIKTAQLYEEDLSVDLQSGPVFYQPRDLPQLSADSCARKRRSHIDGRLQRRIGGDRRVGYMISRDNKIVGQIDCSQSVESRSYGRTVAVRLSRIQNAGETSGADR